MRRVFLSLVILFFVFSARAQLLTVDRRVDELLARMTLEEKLGQLSQYVTEQPEWRGILEKGLAGSILHGGGAASVNEIQRAVIANSRLKIPLLIGTDVIHGYRTIFPIPLAIASSWDPQLAELSAHVAAREARAAGVRWTFAPMVDIARDPRWGRVAEGAGEDPVLGAAMAAAYVRGFQGTDLSAPDAILACAKHFAAYGAAEGGRDYAGAELSEGTLREVYLPPFKAAVDADVGTLMSAFESLNRVPASANRHLLDDILRREWKFRGFVVSDWDAVAELINHGIASSKQQAAIKAIRAGVDMDMWDDSYRTLAAAVRDGRLAQSTVDTAVRRVLRAKFLVGLFDDPYTDLRAAAAATRTPENHEAARRVAQRSIVLLRNDGNLLPLPKSGRRIAVIGPLADSKEDMLGPWASQGKGAEAVSALEGIRAAVPPATLILHERGSGILDGTQEQLAAAIEVVRQADVTIAVLGESREMSGEAASRSSLELPGQQLQLLQSAVATGKPVVLVLLSGRPLAISWAAEHVPAIVQAWFLGTEGGSALADMLFGDVSPSGKMPITIPRTTGQVPIYYSHLRSGRPPDAEDKFTSKYIDLPLGPLFPFGFGLSYTRFEYSDLKVSSKTMQADGEVRVSADVRNAGERPGDEIVQFYVAGSAASISRPVKELRQFQRVTLRPGETRRVEFAVVRDHLRFWSNGGWIVEPGEFKVWIGPSSATGLEGKFQLLSSRH
jgi:beta-glucosidase